VANFFNNLFITITKKLEIQQIENGNAIATLQYYCPGNFLGITVSPITEAEVNNSMEQSLLKKLTGSQLVQIFPTFYGIRSSLPHS